MIRIQGIYDRNLTFIDVPVDPLEPSFNDVLNDPGAGQVKFHVSDVGYKRSPAIINYTNIVVMNDTDTGKYFAWIIEKRTKTLVGSGEQADLMWTISGRGIAGLFSDAVVYGEYGTKRMSADQRHFSFASKTSNWYNSSDWIVPQIVRWDEETTGRRRHPKGWPDPEAYWIWTTDPEVSAPVGTIYARRVITVADDTRVSIFATCDNVFDLYLDSELIMSGNSWASFQRFDIDLEAGSHVLAAKCINVPLSHHGNNPGALLVTVWQADPGSEKLLTRLYHTNASWEVTATVPGWDPGDIMTTLVAEAKARGVDSMQHMWVDVETNGDSDGVAWPAAQRVERSINIGSELLEMLTQLGEQCDWRMVWDPEGDINHKMSLKLYVHLGEDDTQGVNTISGDPVILRPAFNIVEGTYDGDSSGVKTALLIKTDKGWVEEVSSGTSPYGRKESFLSLGTSASDSQTLNTATAAFAIVGVPAEAIVIKSVSVVPHRPFWDYDIGDLVLAPNDEDVLTPYRVVGIAVNQDTDGHVYYSPQLGSIKKDQVKRAARWLKSMTAGALGGRVASASPVALPSSIVPSGSNPIEVPFSQAGALTATLSPPWFARYDSLLTEVFASLGEAGSSYTILTIYHNGTAVGTVTLAPGALTASTQFNQIYDGDANDYMNIEVTDAASDAADLTVQARFN